MRAVSQLAWVLLVVLGLGGCSVRHMAIDRLGDALAEDRGAFAADDDPELIEAAAPFSLKLIESLLAERPRHKGLLLAAARGFTQYTYAFVQPQAEQAADLARARELEERARRLYRRARDYGLRGLAVAPDEVGLLYWTAAAWGALVSLSKDQPEVIAQLPEAQALLARALALDESYADGALHTLMMAFEPQAARRHFDRAWALSGGRLAAPLVVLAETASLPQQRRGEFQALLRQALRIDSGAAGEHRLANLVAQRRARWLLSLTDELFAE